MVVFRTEGLLIGRRSDFLCLVVSTCNPAMLSHALLRMLLLSEKGVKRQQEYIPYTNDLEALAPHVRFWLQFLVAFHEKYC